MHVSCEWIAEVAAQAIARWFTPCETAIEIDRWFLEQVRSRFPGDEVDSRVPLARRDLRCRGVSACARAVRLGSPGADAWSIQRLRAYVGLDRDWRKTNQYRFVRRLRRSVDRSAEVVAFVGVVLLPLSAATAAKNDSLNGIGRPRYTFKKESQYLELVRLTWCCNTEFRAGFHELFHVFRVVENILTIAGHRTNALQHQICSTLVWVHEYGGSQFSCWGLSFVSSYQLSGITYGTP